MSTATQQKESASMDAVTARLAAMLSPDQAVAVRTTETVVTHEGRKTEQVIRMVTKPAPRVTELCGIGRGPTGRLRNFKAMSDAKLLATWDAVQYEWDRDDEAIAAVRQQVIARGL